MGEKYGVYNRAERVGFEPTRGINTPADFKSAPFVRSGTSPLVCPS